MRLGMDLEIQNMDFDSIITAVTSGKADVGAAGMTVTEDRLKNIDFYRQIYNMPKQVVIVKGSTKSVCEETDRFREAFHNNFVKEHRYEYFVKRFWQYDWLSHSLQSLLVLYLVLILSLIRTSHDRNGSVGQY